MRSFFYRTGFQQRALGNFFQLWKWCNPFSKYEYLPLSRKSQIIFWSSPHFYDSWMWFVRSKRQFSEIYLWFRTLETQLSVFCLCCKTLMTWFCKKNIDPTDSESKYLNRMKGHPNEICPFSITGPWNLISIIGLLILISIIGSWNFNGRTSSACRLGGTTVEENAYFYFLSKSICTSVSKLDIPLVVCCVVMGTDNSRSFSNWKWKLNGHMHPLLRDDKLQLSLGEKLNLNVSFADGYYLG